MSCRRLPFAIALLSCATVLHAARPKPPEAATEAPAKPDPADPVPPYELKNRSAFANPNDIQRAPFWPIGWVKRQAAGPAQPQIAEPVKTTIDEKSFKVTSILLNSGTALAVINGRAYGEGEFLRMPKTPGATPIRIRVMRIADGTVTLQHAEQVLTIPLSRPELLDKKPEELLLDPNR